MYGGRESNTYLDDLWRLNISAGQWSRVEESQPGPSRPTGRDHHSVAYWAGKMFVFGEGLGQVAVGGSIPLSRAARAC